MAKVNVKVFAAAALMTLTGCATKQTEDPATIVQNETSIGENSNDTTTNRRQPAVPVEFIEDSIYDKDGNADYTQDGVDFTVTNMPLEEGATVTLYTTTVENSKVDSQNDDEITNQNGATPNNQNNGKINNQNSGTTSNQNNGKTNNQNSGTTNNQNNGKTNNQNSGTTSNQNSGTTSNQNNGTTNNQNNGTTEIQNGDNENGISGISTPVTTEPQQPQPQYYSIDDICYNSDAFKYYANKLNEALMPGIQNYTSYGMPYGVNSLGYGEARYLLLMLNDGYINDSVADEVFSFVDYDAGEFIKNCETYVCNLSTLQGIWNSRIDYNEFVCSGKNSSYAYGNFLNNLTNQYYNNNVDYIYNERANGTYMDDVFANCLSLSYAPDVEFDEYVKFDELFNSFSEHTLGYVCGRSR